MKAVLVFLTLLAFSGCPPDGMHVEDNNNNSNNAKSNNRSISNTTTNHQTSQKTTPTNNHASTNNKSTSNNLSSNSSNNQTVVDEIITPQSNDLFTVSTFHSLSVYWTPNTGNKKTVNVFYRKEDEKKWNKGYPIKHNPITIFEEKAPTNKKNPVTGKRLDIADYRGSLVHLSPDTSYLIKLQFPGEKEYTVIRAKTWSETFKIKKTIKVSSQQKTLEINESGNKKDGYILYDGTGSEIDAKDKHDYNIRLNGVEYVIVRGFTLKGATKSGIRFKKSSVNRHIVIEDNDISGWGEKSKYNSKFGAQNSAIDARERKDKDSLNTAVVSSVIQRNVIHEPRYGSNSWEEVHRDPKGHPDGPQGISIGYSWEGNLVIRYNEIWSKKGHYYNDIIGLESNSSYHGAPGPDSDIYGNYLAHCFDDAIEAEGSVTNVRIWNNYITETFIGIGNAAVSVGPLYVWRNVFDVSYNEPGGNKPPYASVVKMGSKYPGLMTGDFYFFHNTLLQNDDKGYGGLGTTKTKDGRQMKRVTSRNNIMQVRSVVKNSISTDKDNEDVDCDYDLYNKGVPKNSEGKGKKGVPTFHISNPTIDFATKSGNFALKANSKGVDMGEIIPNFSGKFLGKAPNVGAQEDPKKTMVFGLKALE